MSKEYYPYQGLIMNRKMIFLVVFLSSSLLFSILSGCVEVKKQDTDSSVIPSLVDSEFIGSWEIVSSNPDYETWEFFTNGSAKNFIIQKYEDQNISRTVWYSFTVKSDSLCLESKDVDANSPNYISTCYTYTFSHNTSRVSLFYNDITVMVMEKTD